MRKSKNQRQIEHLYPDDLEAWPKYVRGTVAINEAVRKLCQQKLAERLADRDAEYDNNPALAQYHATEAAILQAQINSCTDIILKLTALPPGPGWVDADPPRKPPELEEPEDEKKRVKPARK